MEYRENRLRRQETLAIEQETVTLEEMTQLLQVSLEGAELGVLDASLLLQEQPTLVHRACLFLGMLEMTRAQEVELPQERAWGEIWVTETSL